MKTLIIAAAAALSLTAPAFAQVTDVEAHFAQDFTSNDAKIYDGVDGGTNDLALDLHAGLYEEDESNNRGLSVTGDSIRVSTKGVANDVAASIFARLAEEDRDND
ncbi:MAG: hypothetical protein HKO95_04030 [Rhodobacteraceae bacterium]|jgi:hypothetical protein|nr:hypothetical protein [Alphaproteobacteria bacterium]NNK65886.1 hypothetical protein [Paracoccaceae bacterium]